MLYKVELTVFHNEVARSDWADSSTFGEYEHLTHALGSANAVFNRMTHPERGVWAVTITNSETKEQVTVHASEAVHV